MPEAARSRSPLGTIHACGRDRSGCRERSRITSAFGAARVYNGEVRSRHLGTDFAGAIGTPVLAPGRGVIAMVADFYLAGKAVYLDHGQGWSRRTST